MHNTVLLQEAVQALNLKENSIVVDCTLGYAGHSFVILKNIPKGYLYAFDQDKEAIKYAKINLNTQEINLGVFENNDSAYYCYKSAGFEEVRIDKNIFKFHNEMWNCVEMILKD